MTKSRSRRGQTSVSCANHPFSRWPLLRLRSKPSFATFYTPGGVSAAFTFDRDLTWPDRRCRRLTEGYLAAGVPVAYHFPNLADALECHGRMKLEMVQ